MDEIICTVPIISIKEWEFKTGYEFKKQPTDQIISIWNEAVFLMDEADREIVQCECCQMYFFWESLNSRCENCNAIHCYRCTELQEHRYRCNICKQK